MAGGRESARSRSRSAANSTRCRKGSWQDRMQCGSHTGMLMRPLMLDHTRPVAGRDPGTICANASAAAYENIVDGAWAPDHPPSRDDA